MMMDAKDTESDLHALKRLYRLIKINGEGTSNTASDLLDERARLLLKNLLDEATKRVLEIPSDELTSEQPSTLRKLSKNAENTRSDKDITTLWKEKGFTPQRSRADTLEQLSKETMLESGPGYRKKRCRVCQRDTVKQLESIEETQFYDAVQHQDIFSDQQNNESDHYPWNSQQETGYLSSNNKMVADIARVRNSNFEATSEVDCLSDEASNAIKQIELCISAFHIGSDDHLQKLNKFHVVDKIEPGNWIMSRNVFVPSQIENVQDFTWARCKNHRQPKIMGEIKKPSRLLVGPRFQEKDGVPKSRNDINAGRTSSEQQESEGTATDSNSSNWRSQQTRSGDGDSEEYSLSNDSASMSSRSGTPSPLYSSYTSNSDDNEDDEVYSSTSSETAREVTSSTSSKSQGYSSKKSANRIKHKKEGGVWRKMKDKLAIIFHHHHHHHHHHHNHDGKKMSRNTSLHKRKGKAFNFKRQEEAYGEKAVEKMSKSLINEKNQQNHFHGLVQGLMKHVKHSKKPKPGKRAFGKKSLKKSHWWQLLQQHHRRAKLHNKTHVKLGLAKKRTRLKALPKPK